MLRLTSGHSRVKLVSGSIHEQFSTDLLRGKRSEDENSAESHTEFFSSSRGKGDPLIVADLRVVPKAEQQGKSIPDSMRILPKRMPHGEVSFRAFVPRE